MTERKNRTFPIPEVKKGEMLPILQAAARKGGLPSGSDCNNQTYVPKYNEIKPPLPSKPIPQNKWNQWFSTKEPLDIKENIFKSFNAGVTNWAYNSYDLNAGAASVILTSKKLRETHIEYYFNTDANERSGSELLGGIGLAHYYISQLRPKTGLPINVLSALDMKAFVWNDTSNGNAAIMWNLNLPVGLRYIIQGKTDGLVFAPEFSRSMGLLRNKELINHPTAHWKIGLGVRWKFIHSGIYFHRGPEINFTGMRLGMSF